MDKSAYLMDTVGDYFSHQEAIARGMKTMSYYARVFCVRKLYGVDVFNAGELRRMLNFPHVKKQSTESMLKRIYGSSLQR